MLFENVSIAGLAHVDAPHTLTSQEINERLKPTFERVRIRADMLGDIAGIHARRLWDPGTQASDVAAKAGSLALERAGVRADQLGMLLNTSVSRDFLEPSTAAIVSGKLGVGDRCITFDVANACLAFVNGMDIAARMIEVGDVQYALIVDGETSNLVYEKTIERLSAPTITAEEVKNELAALTTGSGAAAMLLCRTELAPDAPRYRGAVTRSANEWNQLCLGNLDRMVTDTRLLLIEGIKLAQKTFEAAREELGWKVEDLAQFVIHQVSQPHTNAFIKSFDIDPKKVMTIFGEFGNIGPASVPIVLSKLNQLGRLKKGDRVGLMGIGSGLNCSMAEVIW
jgi:3-oxoacyl-[acyl-carrier-protein] synthase III